MTVLINLIYLSTFYTSNIFIDSKGFHAVSFTKGFTLRAKESSLIKRYCLIIISALFLSALFATGQEVENSSDTNGKNETIQQQVQPEIIDEQQNTNLGHSPENNENPK